MCSFVIYLVSGLLTDMAYENYVKRVSPNMKISGLIVSINFENKRNYYFDRLE